jgi:hypothetical protein
MKTLNDRLLSIKLQLAHKLLATTAKVFHEAYGDSQAIEILVDEYYVRYPQSGGLRSTGFKHTAEEAFQQIIDKIQEDEPAHVTIQATWIVIPSEDHPLETTKTATIDIQIDDLNECEIEGKMIITEEL